MPRTVLVPKGSPLLRDPSTQVLNTYPNGTELIETDAAPPEVGVSDESQVPNGLKLRGATPAALDNARSRFTRDTPADEVDRDVTAYVEFVGPPDPRWLAQLPAFGLRPIAYQQENSYQCFGPTGGFRAARQGVLTTRKTPAILHVTELTRDLKPGLEIVPEDQADVVVLVVGTSDRAAAIRAELAAVPGVTMLPDAGHDTLGADRLRFRARVGADGYDALRRLPRVLAVEPFTPPRAEDEVAGLILAGQYDAAHRPTGSYRRWLTSHGLDGRGVTVGIVDGGVLATHPAFAGRIRDLTGGLKDWHGTMVAGHAAGNYSGETDADGREYGLGTAPAADLLAQDKALPATTLCRQTATTAGPNGAAGLIQNNSWGKGTHSPMDYGSDEAIYDGLVRNADPGGPTPLPLTVCFSSGNQGSQGLTRPKAAKNVLVTGNSESYRPDVGGGAADDIREVYSGPRGSSYGNCGDGRVRPHVVAPGEWTASANHDSHPGQDDYLSPMLTWGGGSSGASPKTAGACALLTQWWRQTHAGLTPSPAALRALVVNGAEPIATGGTPPNPRQGWGRLHLQNVLDSAVARVLVDQTLLLASPLQSHEWKVRAADPSRPVKVTLAWTDPPGPVGSGGAPDVSPVVNRLALRVEAGRKTYRGVADRFRNGFSVSDDAAGPGGAAEGGDNLQNVFLTPADAAGVLRVTVTALTITTDCLTGGFDTPQQDFALIIWNARVEAADTDATVVAAVDPNHRNPPPPASCGGFWSNQPGNGDEYLDGGPAPPSTATTPSPPTPSLPPATDDDPWWAEDTTAPESETTRTAPDPEVSRGVADGFDLLSAADQQAERQPAGTGSAVAALRDRLTAHRDTPATAGRPFYATLVVGPGTRLTVADILTLRALAAAGGLTVVSTSADLLAFLAARVGCPAAVRYRLATGPDELPDLAAASLAEAGGLQQLVVSGPAVRGGVSGYPFDVVPADRVVVVLVRFPHPAGVSRVRLTRPGVADYVWSPGSAPAGGGVEATFRDGVLRLRDPAPTRSVGTWVLEVEQTGPAAAVAVWARGGPVVSVRPDDGPAAEGGTPAVVRIAGDPGTTFERATIPPPRVAAPGATLGENPRTLVVRPRRSRLDHSDGPVSESERDAPAAPVLATMIDVPATTAAAVVDLTIDVRGADAQGNRFARRVRGNVTRLVPRADWMAAGAKAGGPVRYVRGWIADTLREGGRVVGLRITRGAGLRVVSVDLPGLADALAVAPSPGPLTFAVRGRRLLAVYRQFTADPGGGIDGDRGIEGAVRGSPPPRAESGSTDYPDATRFVPAASFRAAADRTISRVVIHITDGGAGIAGPISWFQNPASGVSAHYIVGQDGEVVQMVRDRDIAWHANRANGDSIGIEHCARQPRAQGANDPGLMPTPLQYEASAALVWWLCEQYAIPLDREHILGHAEADTGTSHRACPNAVWDWEYYMALVTTGTSQPPPDGEVTRLRTNGVHRPRCTHV